MYNNKAMNAMKNQALTKEVVEKVAKLARLPLKEKEIEKLTKELSETLEFIEKIKAVKTENIKPTSQVTGLENVYREDVVRVSLPQKAALSQATSTYKGYFRTTGVLEGE